MYKNILLGHTEFGKEVLFDTEKFLDSSSTNGRLLFQGISGSWKTETIKTIIRGLKEVTRTDQNPNGIQQIIFDWEGEYHPLRKSYPYLLIGDEGEFPADIDKAEDLAKEIRKTQASVIIDLSSFTDFEKRQEFVGIFLNTLINMKGKQYWTPCVVVIDEAHNLCHQGESRSPSRKPVIACVETGRKRGISTILVTQRLSALDKNATAQTTNRLIGLTVEVPDRIAAMKLLGSGQSVMDQLKDFDGGEYFAFGRLLAHKEILRFKVVQREIEKPDLLNIAPLNVFGQQVFQEIADRINFQTERAEVLNNPNPTTFVPDEEPNADSGFKDYDPDGVKKFLKYQELNQKEKIKHDVESSSEFRESISDSLEEKGRVHLTQSELRKVKLEQWNKAFEYILQASETRKGILRRKIKLTDILKVKTRNGDEKYIITGMQDFCKRCKTMLEGNEKSICANCIREKTERRK